MTSPQTEQPAAKRLPYEKPMIRSISLVADQVLGVGCKTTGGSPPAVGNLVGCITTACFESGS